VSVITKGTAMASPVSIVRAASCAGANRRNRSEVGIRQPQAFWQPRGMLSCRFCIWWSPASIVLSERCVTGLPACRYGPGAGISCRASDLVRALGSRLGYLAHTNSMGRSRASRRT